MAALEELFANPKIALGYGLLASRENPIGAAFGLLQQGQELRQNQEANAIRNKLIERQMRGLDIEEMKAQREAEMNDRIMQELEATGGGGLKTIGALYDRPTLYQYGKDLEEQQLNQNTAENISGGMPQGSVDLSGVGQETLPPIDGMDTTQPTEAPANDLDSYAQSIMNERRRVSLMPKSDTRDTYLDQLDKELQRIEQRTPSPEVLFKEKEANEAKQKGIQQFDEVLSTMESILDQQLKKGDIANTGNEPLENLGLNISNSIVGREVQDMFGTERASDRQTIENLKPRLLQSLMQATGQSARSLDSNTELKLALDALGSPTQTYESRKQALESIRAMYAGGGKQEEPLPAEASKNSGFGGIKFLGFE